MTCQIPNQNLETACNSKLKFAELRFLLRVVNTFTADTEKYTLLKVHDFKFCAHKSYVCKPVNIQLRSFRILIKRASVDMELSIYFNPYICTTTKQKQLFL